MTTHNAVNERVKRQYFAYLAEAQGHSARLIPWDDGRPGIAYQTKGGGVVSRVAPLMTPYFPAVRAPLTDPERKKLDARLNQRGAVSQGEARTTSLHSYFSHLRAFAH